MLGKESLLKLGKEMIGDVAKRVTAHGDDC